MLPCEYICRCQAELGTDSGHDGAEGVGQAIGADLQDEETDSGLDETGESFIPGLLDQQQADENEDTHEECRLREEVGNQ